MREADENYTAGRTAGVTGITPTAPAVAPASPDGAQAPTDHPDAKVIVLCARHMALDAELAATGLLPETEATEAAQARINAEQRAIGRLLKELPPPVTLAGFGAMARALISTDASALDGGCSDELLAQALIRGLAAHGAPTVSA